MKTLKQSLPILFIVILSYFSVRLIFHAGFFPIHDNAQVQRVYEMSKALEDGMFPVRWVADLGYNYGYPIFNFYAPLAYYVGGYMTNIGIDALNATKTIMVLAMLISGITMYLFAKEFWGKLGGVLTALLYVYAPYHAVELYVRGDIAELWGYAFIPLAFYGLWKTFSQRQWRYVAIGASAYAFIVISHNLTALMITPFFFVTLVILYIASYSKQKELRTMKKQYYLPVILLIGILLAAFYWLPTLTEMKYTNVLSQIGGGADFHDHFVCLNQLWNSPWGYGGSTSGCLYDGLSFKIGKIHIVLAIIGLTALLGFWKKAKTKFSLLIWFAIALLCSVFLMLESSSFIWNAIPQMAFIQYPWRFLMITSFFSSFLGGGTLYLLQSKFEKHKTIQNALVIIGIIGAIGIVLFNAKVFIPQTVLPITAQDYTNFKNIAWTTSKISDEYLMPGIHKPNNFNEIPQSKIATDNKLITITKLSEKTQDIHAIVTVKQNTTMTLHLNYFPTWHIFIDGKIVEFKYFNKGLLVNIPQGTHLLEVKFIQTPIEKLANALSLSGVLVLILGIIMNRKEFKHAKKTT
jgi:hypothetical protein